MKALEVRSATSFADLVRVLVARQKLGVLTRYNYRQAARALMNMKGPSVSKKLDLFGEETTRSGFDPTQVYFNVTICQLQRSYSAVSTGFRQIVECSEHRAIALNEINERKRSQRSNFLHFEDIMFSLLHQEPTLNEAQLSELITTTHKSLPLLNLENVPNVRGIFKDEAEVLAKKIGLKSSVKKLLDECILRREEIIKYCACTVSDKNREMILEDLQDLKTLNEDFTSTEGSFVLVNPTWTEDLAGRKPVTNIDEVIKLVREKKVDYLDVSEAFDDKIVIQTFHKITDL